MRLLLLLFISSSLLSFGQAVPNEVENIPFLVTFGKEGDKSWGDDDFCQIFFFKIPLDHKDPVYIRVFDPGVGGKHDEKKGDFNTKMKYSVYGGKGILAPAARRADPDPAGKYKAGNLLASKTFKNENDDGWYTFGPFNPTSGFKSQKFDGYVFKIICEGVEGDDGNLYRYFLSSSADKNVEIEGGNAFCYEYTFRMHEEASEISHIYPYIDSATYSIKQGNFDWDYDGHLLYISKVTKNAHFERSGDGDWGISEHKIKPGEKEHSLDVQFHKNQSKPAKNNNVSIFITNQDDEGVAFYTVPIGGVPEYKAGSIKLIGK